MRETNPDSTNPDGFDYGARIIAEQTSMGLPRSRTAVHPVRNRISNGVHYGTTPKNFLRTTISNFPTQSLICKQFLLSGLAPYSNSEGICSTGARNKAAAKLCGNIKFGEAAYVKPTRKLLRAIFTIH